MPKCLLDISEWMILRYLAWCFQNRNYLASQICTMPIIPISETESCSCLPAKLLPGIQRVASPLHSLSSKCYLGPAPMAMPMYTASVETICVSVVNVWGNLLARLLDPASSSQGRMLINPLYPGLSVLSLMKLENFIFLLKISHQLKSIVLNMNYWSSPDSARSPCIWTVHYHQYCYYHYCWKLLLLQLL